MQTPNYFYILSDMDKYQYTYMRALMSAPANKNQRNKRIETFTEAIDAIKAYAVRGDKDDWRRCLVCGIFWFPEGIAINTRQLRLLIFKCKSSINGSLQKMGYATNMGRAEAANLMISAIPSLKDSPQDLRQWTVRQKGAITKPIDSKEEAAPSAKSPDLEISSPEPLEEAKTFSIIENPIASVNEADTDAFLDDYDVPIW